MRSTNHFEIEQFDYVLAFGYTPTKSPFSTLTPELDKLLSLCKYHLSEIVEVKVYDYAPCYLWQSRPLYNEFGEQIELLNGNTIYLHNKSDSPARDLFHELGHLAGRKYQLIGNPENGYRGSWEQNNGRLIAQVSQSRHWSSYLNLFAMNQKDFKVNAASELWAELFMLWHLQPNMAEARLIDQSMDTIASYPEIQSISLLASETRVLPN